MIFILYKGSYFKNARLCTELIKIIILRQFENGVVLLDIYMGLLDCWGSFFYDKAH